MRGLLPVWLAIAIAGCQPAGAGNELGLCSAFCRCAEQLPSLQRACVDECVDELADVRVPSACEECLFEHAASCDDLLATCEDPCSDPAPDDSFAAGPDELPEEDPR